MSPRVGAWIERHGGRGALAAGTLVMAAGLLIAGRLAQTLVGWYAAWTVIGAGMAMGLYDAAFATIGGLLGSQAWPDDRRRHAGWLGSASTIGWPAGVALIHRFDWRLPAAIYAGVQLAVNLPLILALIPRARHRLAPVLRSTATIETTSHGGLFVLLLLGAFFSACGRRSAPRRRRMR